MLTGGPDAGAADQATALRALVDRLDDIAGLLAGIRAAVAAAWDDPAGEAVTARLDLVGCEVGRLADEAARDATRAEDAVPGMRLPGLTGTRVTDRRGPVAPSLAGPHER